MNEQPNLDYINKLADGDDAIQQRLLSVLKQEFPEEVAIYKNNLLIFNYLLAAEAVHKIRHKIGLLGFEDSYYSSKIYEQNLRNNTLENQNEFENTIMKIDLFLKDI
jgi:hypothetical protein